MFRLSFLRCLWKARPTAVLTPPTPAEDVNQPDFSLPLSHSRPNTSVTPTQSPWDSLTWDRAVFCRENSSSQPLAGPQRQGKAHNLGHCFCNSSLRRQFRVITPVTGTNSRLRSRDEEVPGSATASPSPILGKASSFRTSA